MEFEKIIIVTQKTWLDTLIEEHNTKEQAKFYIEHLGGNFDNYLISHQIYYQSLRDIKKSIPPQIKTHVIEKEFLPNFLFNDNDLIIVLGRDGLVINTAKYLKDQIIIGVNPDPSRIDGILLPYTVEDLSDQIKKLQKNDAKITSVSLSKAEISTNQTLIGVNDLFIGHRSHQSARYNINFRGEQEKHSSSGVIVSTGIGSTGWLRSILIGAIGISSQFYGEDQIEFHENQFALPWDTKSLYFCVREPYPSKITETNLVFGEIKEGEKLIIESNMPEGGVIFSDGIEVDYLDFNSGVIAEIGLASKIINLLTEGKQKKRTN